VVREGLVSGLHRHLVSLMIVALLVSCESPIEPTEVEVSLPDVTSYVVGEAAAALDAAGHFVLPPIAAVGRDAITPEIAEKLAVAYAVAVSQAGDPVQVPGFGVVPTRQALEEEHGRPIRWDHLRAGIRPPVVVHEYLEALPDSIPSAVHNYFGPHYLVPLYDGGIQILTIAVAAYTPARLDERSHPKGRVGNDFRPYALPYDVTPWHPVPAEVVVKYAAELLGARIAVVPRFLAPGHSVSVVAAIWELELERPVTVRRVADGTMERTSTIYVNQFSSFTDYRPPSEPFGLRMFVASSDQPRYERIGFVGKDGGSEFSWPIRPDVPVNFDEVAPDPDHTGMSAYFERCRNLGTWTHCV
jgi:hypothetical protein